MAKYCPSCGFSIKFNENTCPSCGFDFSVRNGFGSVTPSFCMNCGMAVNGSVANCPKCGTLINPNAPVKKKSNFVKALGIVFGLMMLFIIGTAAIAIPNFKKARARARQKACFSNIRVLTGGVELYNMDAESKDEMMKDLDVRLLVNKGYLKTDVPRPEPQCSYSSKGDLTDDGVIYCKYHGELPGYR
jgi:competence protein ComGC/RNA polymerase subunit RPABC4/transcription elongation factor Spt4